MSRKLCDASFEGDYVKSRGFILVVSKSKRTISSINKCMFNEGYTTLVVSNSEQALSMLSIETIDFIMIDADYMGEDGDDLVSAMRLVVGDQFIPMVVLASVKDEELLTDYISAGCDDFILKPFSPNALIHRITSMDQLREFKQLYKNSIHEQVLAKRVLSNALAGKSCHLEEVKLLSKSAAVFSGDLFLTARHPDGSLYVLMADFTGHGLSAAIGVLPVTDVFNVMTEKGFALESIIESLNKKLFSLLPASMFMAACLIKVDSDLKHMRIWNGGLPEVFIREFKTGLIKHKERSTHIALGIDEELQNEFNIQNISIDSGDQIFMYTDGLTDAENADGEMFGVDRLNRCFDSNRLKQSIYESIVKEINEFTEGTELTDDVTLAYIPCTEGLVGVKEDDSLDEIHMAVSRNSEWSWYIELAGSSLRDINPVPVAISEIANMSGFAVSTDKLSNIMSVLYENAINQNIMCKEDLGRSDKKTESNKAGFVRIGIKDVIYQGQSALFISMENSGQEFSQNELMNYLDDVGSDMFDYFSSNDLLHYNISNMSDYQEPGNRLEVIICNSMQKAS